jgi:hydrogenase maturation factor
VNQDDVDGVIRALGKEQIDAAVIGDVQEGPVAVWQVDGDRRELLPRPARDAVSVLFEQVGE